MVIARALGNGIAALYPYLVSSHVNLALHAMPHRWTRNSRLYYLYIAAAIVIWISRISVFDAVRCPYPRVSPIDARASIILRARGFVWMSVLTRCRRQLCGHFRQQFLANGCVISRYKTRPTPMNTLELAGLEDSAIAREASFVLHSSVLDV